MTARGDNFFESCGADCSEIQLEVPPRAKVSFEGLPEEGSVFWDWNDGVSCHSSENPCEVVVLEPAEISANFSTGHFFSKTFQVPPKVETTFEYAETGYRFTVPEGAALRDTTLTLEVKFNSRGESKTNVIFPQNADWAESVVIKVSAYNRETWCNFMDDTLLQQACKQSYSEN